MFCSLMGLDMGAFDKAWKILKEDPNAKMGQLFERYSILLERKEKYPEYYPDIDLEMRQIQNEMANLRQQIQIPPSPQTQVQPTSGDYYQTMGDEPSRDYE